MIETLGWHKDQWLDIDRKFIAANNRGLKFADGILETILIKEKKPILLSFSTPGLCVTGACAPQMEELKKISNSNNDVIIIHVEIWKNFDEVMKKGDLSVGVLNDSVQKFNIKTEPWTFLINSKGIVKNRYQGFVESKEIKLDLSKLDFN